jgi:hypothetical protein
LCEAAIGVLLERLCGSFNFRIELVEARVDFLVEALFNIVYFCIETRFDIFYLCTEEAFDIIYFCDEPVFNVVYLYIEVSDFCAQPMFGCGDFFFKNFSCEVL